MSDRTTESGKPELKMWSFESFGQVLKVSGSLEPDIFPYRVSLSKDSAFFKAVYDGVYKGKKTTVFGTEKGKQPIANGIMVEHITALTSNDLGEVAINKEVFQGDFGTALTDYSQAKMTDYDRTIRYISLPPGWRRFGLIHSHPVYDVLNSIIPIGKQPDVYGIGVSWSGGDFSSLIEPIRNGDRRDMVLGVINPVQLGFMVATKKTCEVLSKKYIEIAYLLKAKERGFPSYKNFEKLGIILYAGNHRGFDKNIILQRLIY